MTEQTLREKIAIRMFIISGKRILVKPDRTEMTWNCTRSFIRKSWLEDADSILALLQPAIDEQVADGYRRGFLAGHKSGKDGENARLWKVAQEKHWRKESTNDFWSYPITQADFDPPTTQDNSKQEGTDAGI